MAIIKIDGIVDKSSEDSSNKLFADNLLKTKDFKSWKCKEWEENAFIVFELKEPQKVESIEIGNDCSAFIEVLVANSSDPKPRFQVLLSTSSFMTPSDSKSLNNCKRIREFPNDKLSPNARNDKWNRFKTVCKQPFNREISFGLAFIRFNTKEDNEEEMETTNTINFGPFRLRSDDNKDNDSETNSGSLFAKRNQMNNLSKQSSLASAVGLTSSSSKTIKPKQNSSPKQNNSNTTPKAQKTANSPSMSSSSVSNQSLPTVPKRQRKTTEDKPFNQIMSGIVFAISGFVNPKRSEIRDKAIKMGAKYRADWDQSCTHLICAFPNTPKFNDVKTQNGKIVTENWIHDSFNQKKLLFWKKYVLGQTSDEEEEEDDDEEYMPLVQKNRKRVQYIDDEEEEESQMREVIGFVDNKSPNDSQNDDIYDMETDNE